jgi:hypothetical protein
VHYLIYKITNKLDNKIYVGKHKTEDKDDDYFGSGKLLKRAVKKHGKENFTKEIMCECDSLEQMNQIEAAIVDEEFIARDDTYNLSLGGEGGWEYVNANGLSGSTNNLTNQKWRDAMVICCKNMHQKYMELIYTDENFRREHARLVKEGIAKSSFSWRGRKHTAVACAKMASHDRAGEKCPSFGMMWTNNGVSNRKIKKTEPMLSGYVKGRLGQLFVKKKISLSV